MPVQDLIKAEDGTFRYKVEIGPTERRCRNQTQHGRSDEIISTCNGPTWCAMVYVFGLPPERDVIWTRSEYIRKQVQRLWRLTWRNDRVVGPARPSAHRRTTATRRCASGSPMPRWPGSSTRSRSSGSTSVSPPISWRRCARWWVIAEAPVGDDLRAAFAEAATFSSIRFAPMMPHLAEERLEGAGRKGFVAHSGGSLIASLLVSNYVT